jgi:F0F1-type ATP synthase membrane subunit c/vacuolar-type H+-ATPase subunit K
MEKRLIIAIIIALSLVIPRTIRAQGLPAGIALEDSLKGQDVAEGMIVCSQGGTLGLCEDAYETSIYGVVRSDPIAAVETDSLVNGYLVVSGGVAPVLIETDVDEVPLGAMITSSDQPGVGQIASNNGMVLGVVQQATSVGEDGRALVPTLIHIHYTSEFKQGTGNIISLLRSATLSPILDPLASFRYAIAALLVLLSFLLGFIYFGRMARAGVEALGRNPLAARQIQLNVLVNSIVTVIIILVGLGSAYLVLIL